MPAAARMTDKVQHTNKLLFITGAAVAGTLIAVGLLVGGAVAIPAAAVGATIAVVSTVGAGFSIGAGLAQVATEFKAVKGLLEDGPITGPIMSGSLNVTVG